MIWMRTERALMSSHPPTGKLLDSETDDKQEVLSTTNTHTKKKEKAFLTYNLHHLWLHGGLQPHGGDVEAGGAAGAKQRGKKPDGGTQRRDGLETLPLRVDDRVKLIKQTATMELRSG